MYKRKIFETRVFQLNLSSSQIIKYFNKPISYSNCIYLQMQQLHIYKQSYNFNSENFFTFNEHRRSFHRKTTKKGKVNLVDFIKSGTTFSIFSHVLDQQTFLTILKFSFFFLPKLSVYILFWLPFFQS